MMTMIWVFIILRLLFRTYVENYQIEKNIIRNRRDTLEDLPERQLTSLPYALDPGQKLL